MTLTDRVDPGFDSTTATLRSIQRAKPRSLNFCKSRSASGPSSSSSTSPAHGSSPSAGTIRQARHAVRGPRGHRRDGRGAARDVAFRNKEIDLSILGPAQYLAYREDPNLKNGILEVAEVFTRHMGMNLDFKAFADKRVRQAINHAIDTDLIIKRLVKDKAYRATSWLPLTRLPTTRRASPTPTIPRRRRSCSRRPATRTASSSNGRPARTRAGACRSSRRSSRCSTRSASR